jgi:hypothetical protein
MKKRKRDVPNLVPFSFAPKLTIKQISDNRERFAAERSPVCSNEKVDVVKQGCLIVYTKRKQETLGMRKKFLLQEEQNIRVGTKKERHRLPSVSF